MCCLCRLCRLSDLCETLPASSTDSSPSSSSFPTGRVRGRIDSGTGDLIKLLQDLRGQPLPCVVMAVNEDDLWTRVMLSDESSMDAFLANTEVMDVAQKMLFLPPGLIIAFEFMD